MVVVLPEPPPHAQRIAVKSRMIDRLMSFGGIARPLFQ
jgi:hypothetical protein